MDADGCDSCRLPEKNMDDCYNKVIEKLAGKGKIKEVSNRLISLSTNHERVLYLYSILKELRFLPIVTTNGKDNDVAIYYRNHGNTYFKQKKYFEAYQCYNLSFLYAVTSSEHFIYAVSNRSAVFFSMGKYKECLEDIRFVFNTQFPDKIRNKLIERKKQAEILLAQEVKAGEAKAKANEKLDAKIAEILTLKGVRDSKYVSASSKLKVVYTEEMGRHVVAAEDINVGEVLVQEEPYLTVLLKPQFLFSCSYCLSRSMNLYPCMTCTYTMYCSVACRDEAFNKYHVIECGLLPTLISMEFTKMELLALRAMVRTRTDQQNWPDMFAYAEEAESKINTDLWGCVKVGNNWVYDSKYYSSIHTLATNIEKRTVSDIFRKSLSAAVLTHFLSVINFLKSDDIELGDRAKKYASGTILLHIMTSPTNMHGISTNIENAEGKFVEEHNIASGAYAFLSLLNHSCVPNVVRYSKLGSAQMNLVAIRPIKKGMQIFDNYGYHYAVLDRASRQTNLKFQYKFNCACEACIDEWPLHANLKEAKGLPAAILQKKEECLSPENIDLLMRGDKDTAVKAFKPLCELIEVLDPFAPCRELAECQEAMKQCLVIFHGVVPFGYTKVIPWNASPPCASTGGPPHYCGYISGPTL